jgi:hypothetical protein
MPPLKPEHPHTTQSTTSILPILLALLLLHSPAHADWTPFVLPWDDATSGVTHFGAILNRGPADAPVTVGDDGHLHAGGERLRILGMNMAMGANFPTHADAERIAARLAKFGINCVRFHHMDSRRFPQGILHRSADDTRTLDPEALDRLDYFIAQLKRQGIYSNINLLVGRPFTAADGLPPEIDAMKRADRKVLGIFHPRVLDLQKEYARALLTRVNPYTGRAYVDEPAVAMVEIANEVGLLHSWLNDDIDELPEAFASVLRDAWNRRLAERFASTEELAAAWGFRDDPLGGERLVNESFVGGIDPWWLHKAGGADGTVSVETDPATGRRLARIDATRPGLENWHLQLFQSHLPVAADSVYTLRFRARADPPRTVRVMLQEDHAEWRTLGLNVDIDLTSTFREFDFTFVAARTETDARILFGGMGTKPGSVWIGDVSFRSGGRIGLPPDCRLETATIPLLLSDDAYAWSSRARRDFAEFLRRTEGDYWRAMRDFLKNDLGVAAPIVGTAMFYSTPDLMREMDIVDSHAYWQHPRFPNEPWDGKDWRIENISMMRESGGTIDDLAADRIAGKPFIVSEYNHPAPNNFSAEAPLLLAAYGALQDWDGIFMYTYSHEHENWDLRRIRGFFDFDQHPTKMANMLIAAMIFRRADVAPAREIVDVPFSASAELDAIVRRSQTWNTGTLGMLRIPGQAALLHRLRTVVGPDAYRTPLPMLDDFEDVVRFESDTGEIVWDTNRLYQSGVTIDTPRTKAIIAFIGLRTFELGDVTIVPGETQRNWCTVALTLTEGETFSGPGRALLVAAGIAENTAMGWNDERTTVGDQWGEAPSLIESVPMFVDLPRPAAGVRAWTLDERGNRARPITVTAVRDRARIDIPASAATLWYELEF